MTHNPENQQIQAQQREEDVHMCSCGGDCLTLGCPCFKRGRFCDKSCKCPNCKNNESHSIERLEVIEQILTKDPMAFTAEETLNQEECASICNFAMLTSSVDATPFNVTPRDSSLSRLLTSDVINQAIRTVMSAANDKINELNNATPENFEELAENSVASEFENVLRTIVNHIKPQQQTTTTTTNNNDNATNNVVQQENQVKTENINANNKNTEQNINASQNDNVQKS